jgi:hypothetical protein
MAVTINRTRLAHTDIDYIRSNYSTVEQVCAGRPETPEQLRALMSVGILPAPAYVLADGTEMLPAGYRLLVDRLYARFERRFLSAGGAHAALEDAWRGYLSGGAALCLRHVVREPPLRRSRW